MDHKREHQTPPLARVMGVGRQQHCHCDVISGSPEHCQPLSRVIISGFMIASNIEVIVCRLGDSMFLLSQTSSFCVVGPIS